MPDDAIQEAGNRKETTRQTRQVERCEGKIQQEPRRSCRNGRWYPHKAKENDQVSNSNQASSTGETHRHRQRQRQRRPTKEDRRLSKTLKQVGRIVRLDVRIRRLSKILKMVRQDRVQESRRLSTVHSVYTFIFLFQKVYCSVVSSDCSYYLRKFTFSYFTSESCVS